MKFSKAGGVFEWPPIPNSAKCSNVSAKFAPTQRSVHTSRRNLQLPPNSAKCSNVSAKFATSSAKCSNASAKFPQLGEVFERFGEVCNFAASKSKFKTFIQPAFIQSMKFKTSG